MGRSSSTAAVLAANLITGRLTHRFGTRPVLVGGALLMALSLASLRIADTQTSYAMIAVPLAALGFAMGAVVPAMTAALLGSVDKSRSGIAAGTLNTARQTGSAIGVSLFGSFAATRLPTGLVAGLHLALLVSVVLACLVAALAVLIGREPRPGVDRR